ncbi:acyl-ACP--UDP-N-acetylglucosamine O-acyltransferase [Acetobacteraceae bacterium H6797]|nr:acyl-ACP--UDP-N-acetylglucosamine O-acyltransferase [Acetobacteraceae bacterium H6797]
MIAPTAVIAPGAVIGAKCRIGPFCSIGPEVVLEEGVELVSHVVVDGITRIGVGAKIWPFATVGLPPQDLKYRGEPTRTVIGARTHIREHATIHRGSVGGHGVTTIGDDCLIMCVAHVGHDCQVGNQVILVNNVMLAGHVEVGDCTMIAGGAAVQQFVRIGPYAMIAGMSGVEKNVIPYGRVKGYRAVLTGLNVIGMRRRLGLSKEQVMGLHAAVVDLYRRPGTPEENLEAAIATHGGNPLFDQVVEFMNVKSKHRLCSFRRGAAVKDEESGDGA